jgi:hypothetical protein
MNSSHVCRIIIKAGHAGDGPVVVAALTHDDPAVRVAALGAALRADVLTTAHLQAALADPDTSVRYRAIELAARWPAGKDSVEAVVAALDDDELAEVAAFALGEMDLAEPARSAVVAALRRQATGHDDALCREAAVAALGAIGDGLDAILAATGDVATVRRRAVLALAPFDGPEVEQALTTALDDRDWQVRQAAEDLQS